MVKAGEATDKTIASLTPHLDKGDILIDGGNTYYKDTIRRNRELSAQGFNFIGTGVSGGEEGALKGPSIMPGGQKEAYELVALILRKLRPVLMMVTPALPISALTVLAITLKWFTTVSNTVICN